MGNPLESARVKPARLIVGLMSGTSADGVDAYPPAVRSLLLGDLRWLPAEEVTRLNFLIGEVFAEAALQCIREAGLTPGDFRPAGPDRRLHKDGRGRPHGQPGAGRQMTHEDVGVGGKAKEALAFALLGNELIGGVPNNVPAATGARRPVVMGKIALP